MSAEITTIIQEITLRGEESIEIFFEESDFNFEVYADGLVLIWRNDDLLISGDVSQLVKAVKKKSTLREPKG